MNATDYKKILYHLEAATSILTGHQSEVPEIDVRIRHLLSITMMETKRGLRSLEPSVAASTAGAVADDTE